MAKRKERRPLVAPTDQPFNNPFAQLGGKEAQPSGESSLEAQPEPVPAVTPLLAVPRVVVRCERKGHGGKTVTLVEGLPPDSLAAVAQHLRRALGCGARADVDTLVLQGDQRDAATAFLTEQGVKRVVRG